VEVLSDTFITNEASRKLLYMKLAVVQFVTSTNTVPKMVRKKILHAIHLRSKVATLVAMVSFRLDLRL
jgi:hypothetical protein